MRYVLSVLLAMFGCYSQQVFAYSCTPVTAVTTISQPNITIARNVPVGTEIGRTSTGTVSTYNCVNTDPKLTYQTYGVKGLGTYVTTIDGKRIYSTGITGIGYAVEGTEYACNATGWVGASSASATLDGNLNNRGLCSINGMLGKQPVPMLINIVYFKIAEITGSGTVSPGEVAAFILRNNQSVWMSPESDVVLSSLTITTIPCEVNQTVINVAMGEVEKKLFKGIGTWADDSYTKNFEIPLTCNPEAKVKLQIDGDAQNTSQGVLNLTQSSDSASGVGVQLLFNKTPLTIGSAFDVGTTTINGLFNIPLQARYYQTDSTIKAGVANATATFTITYQ